MEQREGFKRVTVEDIKAQKEQKEQESVVDRAMNYLDELINKEVEKFAQELVNEGYDVDSFEIIVEDEWTNGKLIAHLKVVQEGKTLEFNLDSAAH